MSTKRMTTAGIAARASGTRGTARPAAADAPRITATRRDVRAALDRSCTVGFAEVRPIVRRGMATMDVPFICG